MEHQRLFARLATAGGESADVAFAFMADWLECHDQVMVTDPAVAIHDIRENLRQRGSVVVHITDDPITGGNAAGSKGHFFILISCRATYCVETYAGFYGCRCTMWSNWEEGLRQLLSLAPGADRLARWNDMFSAEEMADSPHPLGVTLWLP